MPKKIEGPSQESKSRQTLSYGGDKAKWEAEQVIANLPDSPKVIAYALLSPAELEEYHPEGEETGFIEKTKYKHPEKRTPTLRIELNKERKTKDGDNGKEATDIAEKQAIAREKLNAFFRQQAEIWRELERDANSRLGKSRVIAKTIEQDRDFVVRTMAKKAVQFLEFGDQFGDHLEQGVDQLFLSICSREGVADELATKAWAKALNERRVARPKTKKASSIR